MTSEPVPAPSQSLVVATGALSFLRELQRKLSASGLSSDVLASADCNPNA